MRGGRVGRVGCDPDRRDRDAPAGAGRASGRTAACRRRRRGGIGGSGLPARGRRRRTWPGRLPDRRWRARRRCERRVARPVRTGAAGVVEWRRLGDGAARRRRPAAAPPRSRSRAAARAARDRRRAAPSPASRRAPASRSRCVDQAAHLGRRPDRDSGRAGRGGELEGEQRPGAADEAPGGGGAVRRSSPRRRADPEEQEGGQRQQQQRRAPARPGPARRTPPAAMPPVAAMPAAPAISAASRIAAQPSQAVRPRPCSAGPRGAS